MQEAHRGVLSKNKGGKVAVEKRRVTGPGKRGHKTFDIVIPNGKNFKGNLSRKNLRKSWRFVDLPGKKIYSLLREKDY